MKDPLRKRYLYFMLAGFGAISLSVILFFMIYRLQGIGDALGSISAILAPFVYGSVIAYLLRPICNSSQCFLETHLPGKMRKAAPALAVVISLITGILVVYALIIMIAPQLLDSIVTLWNMIPSRVQEFLNWAKVTFGEDERLYEIFSNGYETLYETLDNWAKNTLMPQVTSIVSGVGMSVWKVLKFLYNILIGLIVATYLLYGRKRFARQCVLIVRSVFSEKWANLLLDEVEFIDRMFGGFIDGKLMDSAIMGVLCYIGCSLLRIPNALLVSAIVGVTNVIPFFGPFIGAVPATLLILIQDPMKALWFVIFILILQQIDGNVIGPRILGNRTGLSGFWVMFAIILFGGMWGIVGMVICVPVFAVFYDLVKRLVCRGLRKRGHPELWEKYKADYPDDEKEARQHKQTVKSDEEAP